MSHTTLAVDELNIIAQQALRKSGVSPALAAATCAALMAAEQAGIASHGFARLPFYLDQLDSGKLKPDAQPVVAEHGSVVNVDADSGLAFPAVQQGLTRGIALAQRSAAALWPWRSAAHTISAWPGITLSRPRVRD